MSETESMIAKWQRARDVALRVNEHLTKACGCDPDWKRNTHIDKYKIELAPSKYPGHFVLGGHSGAYGSSSVYSCIGDNETRFLVAAINEQMKTIAQRADEMAKVAAEEARLAARKEAESVLAEATS